jgi:exosortase
VRVAAAIVFASTVAVVFSGTISGLVRQWTSSPDTSYGAILAVVALGVLWKRRAALTRGGDVRARGRYSIALLVGGLLLYAIGQLGADVYLARLSLVAILAGTIAFAGGTSRLRAAAAPLVFLLIAIPLPTLVVNAVTLPMQLTASRIAEQTLTASGVAVFRDGNVLELPSGSLEVAEACSGLRSAVSLGAIAVLLAWMEPTWPRRIALVIASVPIAIVMNGLRITATAFASEAWGAEAATGRWHEFTGWLTFVACLLALVFAQRLIAGPRSRRAEIVEAMGA